MYSLFDSELGTLFSILLDVRGLSANDDEIGSMGTLRQKREALQEQIDALIRLQISNIHDDKAMDAELGFHVRASGASTDSAQQGSGSDLGF
jgi:hypothetical protein